MLLYGLLPVMADAAIMAQQRRDGGDAGGATIGVVIWLALTVLLIASLWRVFAKAGRPGWAALIPIYNMIVLLEIVGRPWWWLLLMFIPFVNFIIIIMTFLDLARVFGKGTGFGIGLLLLTIIFLPILAFGSARYSPPAPALAPATA